MSDSPVAIITGAGTGIGQATAVAMVGAGWCCALVGRRADKLAETAALAQQRDGLARTLSLDLNIASPLAGEQIVQRVTQRWGVCRISAIVNNAATPTLGPLHKASDELVRQSFETNVFGPFRLVRAAWPHMVREGGSGLARVVNVSSMAVVDPYPGLGVYGMSKSALDGLTRAINNEGAASSIIAFSVVLGPVETAMLRSVVPENQLPRDKVRQPGDVAAIIADCALGRRDHDARKPIVLS